HRDRSRPGVGDNVLNLARKIGAHRLYLLQWHQRQDREENDAAPCQDPKRRSEEASEHSAQGYRPTAYFASPHRIGTKFEGLFEFGRDSGDESLPALGPYAGACGADFRGRSRYLAPCDLA